MNISTDRSTYKKMKRIMVILLAVAVLLCGCTKAENTEQIYETEPTAEVSPTEPVKVEYVYVDKDTAIAEADQYEISFGSGDYDGDGITEYALAYTTGTGTGIWTQTLEIYKRMATWIDRTEVECSTIAELFAEQVKISFSEETRELIYALPDGTQVSYAMATDRTYKGSCWDMHITYMLSDGSITVSCIPAICVEEIACPIYEYSPTINATVTFVNGSIQINKCTFLK